MKVLITGSQGLLGSECAVQLRNLGARVTGTDRTPGADLVGNLGDDGFCRTLPDVDAVLHCAAVQYLSPDLPWFRRAAYFTRNNIDATRNLANRYNGKDTHFLYVGTSMVYRQDGRVPLTPSSPLAAQGVYSASKIAALELVQKMSNPVAAVLPCIIAGPKRGGLFEPFTASVRRLGIAAIPGAGNHPIHVVHVEDAASLIVTVLVKRAQGIFNAASRDPLSIREWVAEIAAELAVPHVRCIHVPLAPIALLARLSGYRLMAREQLLMLEFPHVLDTSAGEALGWEAKWNNAQTIRQTAAALAGASTHGR
jgi:nucleoside-diphosphate-sugar epimerase